MNWPNGSLEPLVELPPGQRFPREIFLVLPGLNLNPARLESWQGFLLGQGCAVSAPVLPGYGADDPALWRRVSAALWLEAVADHARSLNVAFPGVPLSLLGFSMGALLGLCWQASVVEGFARALLVSPPFGLTTPAMALARGFSMLPGFARVPSGGSPRMRRHPYTSPAAYRALLDLHGQVMSPWADDLPGEGFPPRCHVFHPRDRLLDTGPLHEDAQRHPRQVTLVPVPAGDTCSFPRHLVLNPCLTGEFAWRRICALVGDWMSKTTP